MNNDELRNDEIIALTAIYGDDLTQVNPNIYSMKIFSDNDQNKIHPLNIEFKLSENYPLKAKPIVTISAPWMSREDKSMINNEINKLCDQNFGESHQLLFMIIDKLKQLMNETIQILQYDNDDDDKDREEEEEDICTDKGNDLINIYHGTPITDRKSTFQAHLAFVESYEQVKIVLNQLKMNKKIADATHNIYAYRIKNSNNNQFDQDYDDDGETHAGSRVLKLLENMNVINVVVIVTRWFGGTLLGVDRFRHIQNVAKELLIQYKKN